MWRTSQSRTYIMLHSKLVSIDHTTCTFPPIYRYRLHEPHPAPQRMDVSSTIHTNPSEHPLVLLPLLSTPFAYPPAMRIEERIERGNLSSLTQILQRTQRLYGQAAINHLGFQ
jgi:hypothetical protein